MATIKARVKAGIDFMNFIYGDEWRKKVDLETLDLGNCNSCILGQTDTDYESHRDALLLDEYDSHQFGFNHGSSVGIGLPKGCCAYIILTNEWKKQLKA